MVNKLDKLQLVEEQVFCYEQKLAGKSYRQIADMFPDRFGKKVTHVTVRNRVERELAEKVAPSRDEFRQVELDRLERWQNKADELAVAGDMKAMDTGIKLMSRRAALMGLDAPTRVDATVITIPVENTPLGKLLVERNSSILDILRAQDVKSLTSVALDEEDEDAESVENYDDRHISPEQDSSATFLREDGDQ